MLQDRRTDMLLTASRHILRIAIAIMIATMALVVWALVALLFFPSRNIAAELAVAPAAALPLIFVCAGVGLVMLFLGIRFAVELGRIVHTVQQGDPFEPANAVRLARMGWLALGVTLAGWLVMPLVSWLSAHFEEITLGGGTSLGGAALAATLFILARVFRHGAAMRDDLEGTV